MQLFRLSTLCVCWPAQGATFVYEAVLRPVVKILRREIAKNPTLDRALNGQVQVSSHNFLSPCLALTKLHCATGFLTKLRAGLIASA